MSRSQRHSLIIGTTGAFSEKADKRRWHQRWRAKQRAQLAGYFDGADILMVHYREVSDPWTMAKDGKTRLYGLRPIVKNNLRRLGAEKGKKTRFSDDDVLVAARRWYKLIGK